MDARRESCAICTNDSVLAKKEGSRRPTDGRCATSEGNHTRGNGHLLSELHRPITGLGGFFEMNDKPAYLSIAQAGVELFGRDDKTTHMRVARWIKIGLLEAVREGKRYWIPRSEIDRALTKKEGA